MRSVISVSIILISVVSCKPTSKDEPKYFWESIEMELGSQQRLLISNFKDSVVFANWKDSLIDKSKKWDEKSWVKIQLTKQKIKITKEEKDSLFRWARNLVKPASPTIWCTDYSGYFQVKINYGSRSHRTTQTCEYQSICDWYKVSNDAKLLYSFLRGRFNNVE